MCHWVWFGRRHFFYSATYRGTIYFWVVGEVVLNDSGRHWDELGLMFESPDQKELQKLLKNKTIAHNHKLSFVFHGGFSPYWRQCHFAVLRFWPHYPWENNQQRPEETEPPLWVQTVRLLTSQRTSQTHLTYALTSPFLLCSMFMWVLACDTNDPWSLHCSLPQ